LCIYFLINKKTGTHWDVTLPVSLNDIIAHVLLLQDYLGSTPKINHVFWSIAVEWKIYFLFPIVIFFFLKYPKDNSRLLITALFCIASFILYKEILTQFGSTQSMHYLGLFCFGVLGCFIAFGKNLKESKYMLYLVISMLLFF